MAARAVSEVMDGARDGDHVVVLRVAIGDSAESDPETVGARLLEAMRATLV